MSPPESGKRLYHQFFGGRALEGTKFADTLKLELRAMRVLIARILLLTSGLLLFAQDARVGVDRVVVYKHERKLVLMSRGKELRSYKVALGGEPVGPKTRQGDHRTPEGLYVLDSRNPNSHFYKAFHVSYPSSKDIETAKKLGVSPGGDIMLHGLPKDYAWLGKTQALHDWTDGCIAVSNQEMDELWNLIRVGTPIEIKP
jgi:murein L,D-transpeptidase YafK